MAALIAASSGSRGCTTGTSLMACTFDSSWPQPGPEGQPQPMSSRLTSVDAKRAGPIGHEQQEAAGNRDILEEIDHLRLISEVSVEGEGREQREPGEKEGDQACVPAGNNGECSSN